MDELEEIVGLCKDEKIVHFVDKVIANVDSVEADDDPTEDVAKVGKPSGHEVLMRFVQFSSILPVEASTIVKSSVIL